MSEEDKVTTEEVTFTDDIPDDIELFPSEEPAADGDEKPPEEPAAKPPAAETAPADKETPPAEKAPEKPEEPPKVAPPPEILKMQQDALERDRKLGERERNLRDAERWRRQAEEYERWQESFRKDPIKAVEQMGGDAMDLVSQKLGLSEPQKPEEAMQQRLDKLERTLADRDKAREEATKQARMEEAQTNILNRYEEFAKGADETHPHLNQFKMASGVMYNKAQEYARMTGRWLPDRNTHERG
jgi:hypothetical protein